MILIGGSFGGMIALTYAVRHPHGLSRLILRGTAASHHHEAEAIENFKARLHKATSASIGMVHKMFSDQVVDDTELRLIWLALMPLYYEKFDPDAALERTRTLQLHAETHNALFAGKNYDLRAELGTIEVPTLKGTTVKLKIPPGTPNGRTFRVRGRGVARKDGTHGDLLVTVEVEVPKHLPDNARAALEEYAKAVGQSDPRAGLFRR